MKASFAIAFAILIGAAGCTRAHTGSAKAAAVPAVDTSKLIARIHFRTASAELEGRARGAVEENTGWMRENSAAVLVLEGHCDERGSEESNLELGDRRARGVMEVMMARGVDSDRLIVLSKGEGEPIDSGHNHASWRRNRRVEFLIR